MAALMRYIPLLAGACWFFGMAGMDGLYGQDSFVYLEYAIQIHGGIIPENTHWGIGYSAFAALLAGIAGFPYALPLASFLAFIVLVECTRASLKLRLPEWSKRHDVLLLVFFVLTPLLWRAAYLGMSDLLGVGGIAICWYGRDKWIMKSHHAGILLAVAGIVIAVLSRYIFVVFIWVPAAEVLYRVWRSGSRKDMLFAVLGLLAVAGILALSFYQHWGNTGSDEIARRWSPLHYFHREFYLEEAHTLYRLPNLLFYISCFLHPALVLGVIPFFTGVKKMQWGIFFTILLYVLIMAGFPTQNIRFFYPVIPLLVLWAFSSTVLNKRWVLVWTPVMGVVSLFFFVRESHKIIVRVHQETEILRFLEAAGSPDVYAVDMDISLKGRSYTGQLYSTWKTEYSYFPEGSIFIWNENWDTGKYIKLNPFRNKMKLLSQPHKEIKTLEGGWVLYEAQ